MLRKFQDERLQMIFVAIATAIAGDFKITPFDGVGFRVALGSVTFLLMLRLMNHLSFIRTGLLTGTVVLFYRMAEDLLTGNAAGVEQSFQAHFPAVIYYLLFAIGMSRIQKDLDEFNPLRVGAIVSVIDFTANGAELVIRHVWSHTSQIIVQQWLFLLALAIVRSYFVIGLYSSISVSHLRLLHKEQKKRIEQMLSFGSGLYGETFYLKKSMDDIEQITASTFQLYQRLKEGGRHEESAQALRIAQQFHEVKKDSQRILAGLLKLFDSQVVVNMRLSEVIDHTVRANRQYAEMLGKEIVFVTEMRTDYWTPHFIPLLTLLNNLAENAVESIAAKGNVRISVRQKEGHTIFTIADNGSGIPESDRQLIFEPGFTTKFNAEGVASTGIGLSHARDIVRSFRGDIDVLQLDRETEFRIRLPTAELKKEG
jgi:two-component system sensor histidine kinase YcbA